MNSVDPYLRSILLQKMEQFKKDQQLGKEKETEKQLENDREENKEIIVNLAPPKHQLQQEHSTDLSNLPSQQLEYLDCVYCINLEACHERRTHMKKQFKIHKMGGIFFDAIHPRHKEYKMKNKNPKWVDQSFDKRRCYCTKDCGHRFRKLRPTEIAISFSHYHIYKKIIKHEFRWTLVCEDDLVFCKNFTEILAQLIPQTIWESPDPIMIFCGGDTDNPNLQINEPDQFTLKEAPKGLYSNYCYLINKRAAEKLYNVFFPIKRPDDSFKRYYISLGKVKSYFFKPTLVGELSTGKNMKSKYVRLSKFRGPPKSKDPNDEYAPKFLQEQLLQKPKRVITYNKTRKTKMIKPKSKKKR